MSTHACVIRDTVANHQLIRDFCSNYLAVRYGIVSPGLISHYTYNPGLSSDYFCIAILYIPDYDVHPANRYLSATEHAHLVEETVSAWDGFTALPEFDIEATGPVARAWDQISHTDLDRVFSQIGEDVEAGMRVSSDLLSFQQRSVLNCLRPVVNNPTRQTAEEVRQLDEAHAQASTDWDAVFGNLRGENRGPDTTPRGTIRPYPPLQNEAQRQAAENRRQAAAAPEFAIDWSSEDMWSSPTVDGARITQPIEHLDVDTLGRTIEWCVHNCVQLFRQYGSFVPGGLESLSAKRWLSAQPAFRALVRTAVRRDMTFTSGTYRYIRDYLILREDDISVSPWTNPANAYQRQMLADFADAPVRLVDAVEEFGKDYREIEL